MVRGSDSEASEGGGFYAARKNGIHGAVDLDGSVGEPVFAVANGKVIVAGDWGKLGKAVILDHRDGGYTIDSHLHPVEVNLNSSIAAGLRTYKRRTCRPISISPMSAEPRRWRGSGIPSTVS